MEGFYQDYLKGSCYAIPVCDEASIDCSEENGLAILTRSTPKAPSFSVATYPTISSADRFSKDSITVTITENEAFYGDAVDQYRIEWSISPNFMDTQYYETDSLEYTISQLRTGTTFFIRISARNSAGYGKASSSLIAKPMQSPDPPYSPIISLLSFLLYNAEERGTMLRVQWQLPEEEINEQASSLVGDGGDKITHYLLEWSKIDWNEFTPTIWTISFDNETEFLEGYFRVGLDTSTLENAAVRGAFISAKIPLSSSASEVKVILQNMPNIGEVLVSMGTGYSWTITFLTELGYVRDFFIAENSAFSIEDKLESFSLQLVESGIIPETAAYSSSVIDSSLLATLNHIIENLIPGQNYFVRLASRNQVGFGPRRETAPRVIATPIQKPGLAVSYIERMVEYS